MGKTVAITNQKGGVGKTTSTLAMAAVLKSRGYKVLMVDCDDTGNPSLSKALKSNPENIGITDLMVNRINRLSVAPKTPLIETSEAVVQADSGIDYIAADECFPFINAGYIQQLPQEKRNMVLKEILESIKQDYDFILLDAAPALNTISVNMLTAADEVIIVTQAQGASEEGILSLLGTVSDVKAKDNPDIVVRGLLVTMYDARTNYSRSKADCIAKEYTELGLRTFKTAIPRSVRAEECTGEGKSIIEHDPKGKVSCAYIEFVDEYISGEVK